MDDNGPSEDSPTCEHTGLITQLSAAYDRRFGVRAAIQAIPVLGGPLDQMLSGLGANWQADRLESLVGMLSERLEALERAGRSPLVEPTEELFDLVIRVFDAAQRTRSTAKRQRFADLLANNISGGVSADDALLGADLLGHLEEHHIEVLRLAVPRPGHRPVMLFIKTYPWLVPDHDNVRLLERVPNLSESTTRGICAALAAYGLLVDQVGRRFTLTGEDMTVKVTGKGATVLSQGVGIGGAQEAYVVSPFGQSFLSWIVQPD